MRRLQGRSNRRRIVWGLIAVAVVGGGWYLLRGEPARRDGEAALAGASGPAAARATVEVRRAPIAVTVSALGSLRPVESFELKPKGAGVIEAVLVERGETVEAGQVIARMVTDDLEVRVMQARASLLNAQAQLQQLLAGPSEAEVASARADLAERELALESARATLAQNEELFAAGAIPRQELDRSRDQVKLAELALQAAERRLADLTAPPRDVDVAAAKERVAEAEANLAQAEQALADATLRTPISGTVIELSAQAGQVVGNDSVLATIADLRRLEATVLVNEIDIPRVAVGQRVEVSIDAFPGRRFEGTVSEIGQKGQTQDNIVSYPVTTVLPNPEGALLPGMTVDVDIIVARKEDALVLPVEAIVEREGTSTVLLPPQGQGSAPQSRPVQIGLRNETLVEITGGLEEGDRVLVPGGAGFQLTGIGGRGARVMTGPHAGVRIVR